MRTVNDVFDAIGGREAASELLAVTPQALTNMKARESIPPRHWPAIINEARRRKVSWLTMDALTEINSPPRRPRQGSRTGAAA